MYIQDNLWHLNHPGQHTFLTFTNVRYPAKSRKSSHPGHKSSGKTSERGLAFRAKIIIINIFILQLLIQENEKKSPIPS